MKKFKYIENIVLICIIIIFIILICMRDIHGIYINKFLFLTLSIIGYVLLKEENIISLICFLIALFPGLPGNYILIFANIFLVFKRKTIILNKYMCMLYSFLILQLLNVGINGGSIIEFISFCAYPIFLSLVLLNQRKNYNITKITMMYCIGVVFANIIVLTNTLKYITFKELLDSGGRVGNIRWFNEDLASNQITLSLDQNTLGYLIIIAISLAFILLYYKKIGKIFGVLLIIVLSFFGLLTLSRSFLLILIVLFIIAFLFSIKIDLKTYFQLCFTALISIYLFLFIYRLFPQVFDSYAKRFDAEDITNGRVDIFAMYMSYFFSNLRSFIIGIGLQDMHIVSKIQFAPHNGLQQILISSGVIGSISFIGWFIGLVKNYITQSIFKDRYIYIPFIIFFIYIQTIQFLSPYIIMLPCVCIILVLDINKKEVRV